MITEALGHALDDLVIANRILHSVGIVLLGELGNSAKMIISKAIN